MKKYLLVLCEGEFEDYIETSLAVVDTYIEAKLLKYAIEQKEQPWFNQIVDKWDREKYLSSNLTPDIIIREVEYLKIQLEIRKEGI